MKLTLPRNQPISCIQILVSHVQLKITPKHKLCYNDIEILRAKYSGSRPKNSLSSQSQSAHRSLVSCLQHILNLTG